MRICRYCSKPELVGVGKENIPVCEKHYNEYLKRQLLRLKSVAVQKDMA